MFYKTGEKDFLSVGFLPVSLLILDAKRSVSFWYCFFCFNLCNNFLNLLSGVIQSGSRVATYTYASDGTKFLGVGDFVHEATHAG